MLLAVAATFSGIYISVVGWGYYVAYGATIAAFALLMGMKDIIDTLMVCLVRTAVRVYFVRGRGHAVRC